MITGNFVTQRQYAGYELRVTPPEIQEGDEDYVRALYDSLTLSFTSSLGPFDMDLYYREEES
jgi:CheY-specific phosphatase CheX